MVTDYSSWTNVEELPLLSVGISQQTQYLPAPCSDLSNIKLVLTCYGDNQSHRTLEFSNVDHVALTDGTQKTVTETYRAFRIRDNIYLVDILRTELDQPGAIPSLPVDETWAIDLASGVATCATSYVHSTAGPEGRRRVGTNNTHWIISGAPSPARHERTDEMIGMRILWQYSDTDAYDHVYLNANNFAWQCVHGVEQGLTELDRAHAYKIAQGLYFFEWSERAQAVESALFVDVHEMRTYGRMFGWEPRTAEVLHHQFGSKGKLLNRTHYPSLDTTDGTA